MHSLEWNEERPRWHRRNLFVRPVRRTWRGRRTLQVVDLHTQRGSLGGEEVLIRMSERANGG